MKKKVTRKDFYMEIRRSPGRFLSILFIVALGVAFFSGIRAAEPSMRITGDAYFDGDSLMDIKALSTYGVTEDDVKAIEEVEGVADAEGAYSADFLYNVEDEQTVLHVMSLQEQMNEVTVSEGRLPEKVGECLADDESNFQIGDVITLESGTDDPVSDTLKTEKLEVVGRGNSPCYISYGRGSTTIGTGNIDAFLIVPESTFDLDVYTEVYVRVEGAEKLLAFSDEYEDCVEEVMDHIEAITDERASVRRQEIVDEANEKLADARKELEDGKQEAEKELNDAAQELADAKKQLDDAKQKISDGRQQIADAKSTLAEKQQELDAAKAQYQSGVQQLAEGRMAYESGLAQFEAGKAQAEAQIKEGEVGLELMRQSLDASWIEYEQLLAMIPESPQEGTPEYEKWKEDNQELLMQAEQMKAALDAQEQIYQEQTANLEAAKQQLLETQKMLDSTKAQLDASEAELMQADQKLQDGQAQIQSGWKEIQDSEKELADGEAEIAENEAKLADARTEYEEGKAEAEAEIADGEAEIADAEEEIAKIESPKWYVYDRSTLTEYNGLGENAERIGAIGRVFPVIFFLVAALISLTSMTRMVEEQRISIGTMKALGYGKFTIAAKYLGYALLATAGGSIFGVLVGEKILPYIIIYAYGILYRHIPKILVPYDWTYAAMASVAAIACTTIATLLACYRELGAQPAVLMRPPAPKKGKRVFLEHISFVWKHLNFTWKSTVRNLMRYKKRFFMTIFGISGCMALMLVGFGLRDSVYEIADLQYAEIQVYDGSIYLQEDLTEEDREHLTQYLEEDDDLARFMEADMKKITLANGKKERDTYQCILSSSENADDYVHFRDRKTKEVYHLSDDGVIISEKTAKLLDAKVGDTICIRDKENGNKEVRIDHICENYMGHYMYMTPKYYEKVYGEKPEYNSVFFAVDDSYSKEDLEDAGQDILAQEEVLSVGYMHDIEKQLDDMLGSLNLVIVVLIISAGMLAFVVLYNLNTINIAERKRELATLRVLGFYNPEVAGYVYRENILLTLIGALVGVGLGRVLHLFIIQTVEVDAAMFGRNINFPSYIYSLLFTIAFSMIVNGIMYFKIKKIDMVESLKSIE